MSDLAGARLVRALNAAMWSVTVWLLIWSLKA